MELNLDDMENIRDALEQMLFRCARNKKLAEDALAAGGTNVTKLEAELLDGSLARFEKTLGKVKSIQERFR